MMGGEGGMMGGEMWTGGYGGMMGGGGHGGMVGGGGMMGGGYGGMLTGGGMARGAPVMSLFQGGGSSAQSEIPSPVRRGLIIAKMRDDLASLEYRQRFG